MHFSKEEKAMWLEDWRKSGKNAWAYARENGLVPQTFTGWTKSRKEKNQSLVEVSAQFLQSTCFIQEWRIEKGDVKIYIPLSIGTSELGTIISSLRGLL